MYKIFGDAAAIKILDWMIANQEYDHSLREIADGTKINLGVVKRNFEPLLQYEVVRVNRLIGRDAMYVLDLQNRCTKAIIEFDVKISKCCERAQEEYNETDERSTLEGEDESAYLDGMDADNEQMISGPPEV